MTGCWEFENRYIWIFIDKFVENAEIHTFIDKFVELCFYNEIKMKKIITTCV